MSTAGVSAVLKYFLAALGMYVLVGQCRKPSWFLGRLIARGMNQSHSSLTSWGLAHVTIRPADNILDIGCGGGKTVQRMETAATLGHVSAIDYSAASVQVARAVNASAIAAGRVDIEEGTASALPFADATFDLVTAVETHYYWPDLPNDLRGVLRVLKPGGHFIIIAEAYRSRRMDWLFRPAMALLRAVYMTPDEHRALFEGAGFEGVVVDTERRQGWICVVGRK
ncbi:MAG TPA: class I SAM-dependent methyltransferase [Gemmatimonadaceae bacterium]|jgi:SAM-dependent methyltransferase|nr:class I SAM-dependent methyltransferase [Gemmatimonadaceae bacterium]